jgi:hypothetical protein
MNHCRVKNTWKFDRKTARRKFGYKHTFFKQSETLAPGCAHAEVASRAYLICTAQVRPYSLPRMKSLSHLM